MVASRTAATCGGSILGAVVAAAERVSPFVRFRVEGDSMAPAYSPGDRILVSRLAYLYRRPRPGDVVVLRDPEAPGRLLLKRVAAVEGSRYVVLGDNAAESRDSRRFGPVRRRDIVGKAVLRY